MSDEQPTPWVQGSDEDILFTIAHALRYEGRKVTRQADQLVAQVAAERDPGGDEEGLYHRAEAARAACDRRPASEDGRRPVMPEAVQAFLDAADDLLTAQQALLPHPLPEELRELTEAYIAMRAALMDEAALHQRVGAV